MKQRIIPPRYFSRCVAIMSIALLLLTTQHLAAETLVLQPGPEAQDSYVCDCVPNANNPNGPITLLYQGRYTVCYNKDLIKWDISALPQGATIISAVMELNCYQFYGSQSGEMIFYRILEDWVETGVTYNTLPAVSYDVVPTCGWPSPGQWISVDVTEFVQGWYDRSYPNYGIMGHSQNTTGTCDVQLCSSDYGVASSRPKLTITYTPGTGVTPNSDPHAFNFSLNQNHPNPFNASTCIQYNLQHQGMVSLQVFNLANQVISTLVHEQQSAGEYLIEWNAIEFPSGIYIVQLNLDGLKANRKVVLLK